MADRNGMVQMKAKMLFTVNSPTTAAILHGDDREKADVAARFPYVSPGDAAFLESKGYAAPYDGRIPAEKGPGDGTGMTVDERSGVYTEHHVDAENSVDQTTGLATRQTTAFEAPIESIAGAGGAGNRQMVVGDIRQAPASEEDAPSGGGGKQSSGGDTGPKPYSQMKTAELEAEADKEPKVDLSAAKNNKERAKLLEKARGGKAPAQQQ